MRRRRAANSRRTWFETRHSPSASSDGIPSILDVARLVPESSPKRDSHVRARIGLKQNVSSQATLVNVEFDPGEMFEIATHAHAESALALSSLEL